MSDTLQIVALACTTVASHLDHPDNEYPHVLKKVTAQGQACFRFATVVLVHGEAVEVQVRTDPASKGTRT